MIPKTGNFFSQQIAQITDKQELTQLIKAPRTARVMAAVNGYEFDGTLILKFGTALLLEAIRAISTLILSRVSGTKKKNY
jgi:hypothetical protein